MKTENIYKYRYLFLMAVIFLLLNSLAFIVMGVVECTEGYVQLVRSGFQNTETNRPSMHLLEGLDLFVSALVFMIFGLGLGQLFVLNDTAYQSLPKGLGIESLKELKVLLWETILVALVIYCVTHLLRMDPMSWEILPFPILIVILSVALFFFKSDGWKRVPPESREDRT